MLSTVGIALLLGACGFGVGRTSSAHTPAVDARESVMILGEEEKDSEGKGTGWFEVIGFKDPSWGNYTRGYFGVHAATLIGRVRSAPDNAPASSGWMLMQHVTGVIGVGAYALQLDWQQRTESFNYDRGFGGELVSKGVVTWFGYAPRGSVGVSVGYGRPRATLGLGSATNRTLYGSVDASGAFYGLALDTFVVAGGVGQWGIRPRLVLGYSSYEADVARPNLPTSYSGLSAGIEIVGTIF